MKKKGKSLGVAQSVATLDRLSHELLKWAKKIYLLTRSHYLVEGAILQSRKTIKVRKKIQKMSQKQLAMVT